MRDAAAAVGARPDGGSVSGGDSFDGIGETETVAVEGAPSGGSDVAEEAVEGGFSVEETLRDGGGEVEVSCAEEVEEDGEAVWVTVDEEEMVLFGGWWREVPVVVEQGAEEGVAACVCEGC